LRLKFESKLNSMHSMHRELEIKYKRLQSDLGTAEALIERHEGTIKDQGLQIIHLKTVCEEQESRIKMLIERREALEREIQLKAKVVSEGEYKLRLMQDELDLKVYALND